MDVQEILDYLDLQERQLESNQLDIHARIRELRGKEVAKIDHYCKELLDAANSIFEQNYVVLRKERQDFKHRQDVSLSKTISSPEIDLAPVKEQQHKPKPKPKDEESKSETKSETKINWGFLEFQELSWSDTAPHLRIHGLLPPCVVEPNLDGGLCFCWKGCGNGEVQDQTWARFKREVVKPPLIVEIEMQYPNGDLFLFTLTPTGSSTRFGGETKHIGETYNNHNPNKFVATLPGLPYLGEIQALRARWYLGGRLAEIEHEKDKDKDKAGTKCRSKIPLRWNSLTLANSDLILMPLSISLGVACDRFEISQAWDRSNELRVWYRARRKPTWPSGRRNAEWSQEISLPDFAFTTTHRAWFLSGRNLPGIWTRGRFSNRDDAPCFITRDADHGMGEMREDLTGPISSSYVSLDGVGGNIQFSPHFGCDYDACSAFFPGTFCGMLSPSTLGCIPWDMARGVRVVMKYESGSNLSPPIRYRLGASPESKSAINHWKCIAETTAVVWSCMASVPVRLWEKRWLVFRPPFAFAQFRKYSRVLVHVWEWDAVELKFHLRCEVIIPNQINWPKALNFEHLAFPSPDVPSVQLGDSKSKKSKRKLLAEKPKKQAERKTETTETLWITIVSVTHKLYQLLAFDLRGKKVATLNLPGTENMEQFVLMYEEGEPLLVTLKVNENATLLFRRALPLLRSAMESSGQ